MTIYCALCSQEITTQPNRSIRGQLAFCSKACATFHQGETRSVRRWMAHGAAYRDYGANWQTQRRATLRRDFYRCSQCKRQRGDGVQLDVHHIRPFRQFGYIPGVNENYKEANELGNLLTLCKACHGSVKNETQGKNTGKVR